MNAAREPLHQPPNPDDLRRAPPATPDCARVRGWLRDYVDRDLDGARARELEEHAHRCRQCNVELARAEHELLRVREAFRALREDDVRLPPDFAARVVEHLVRDDTSLVGAEALDRAAAARVQAAADAAVPPRPAGRARAMVRPGAVLMFGIALLFALGIGLELMRAPGRGPDRAARLYILDADGAYHLQQPLGSRQWLGEHQSLRVRSGGGAHVEWHDPSARTQPAATLQVRGEGEVRLEHGSPMLVNGTVDIETHRPVSIPLADGSQVDLGEGQYTLAADPRFDPANPALSAPPDLYVTIEVRSGEPASVVRTGFGPTLVATGQIGFYHGQSPTTIGSSGGFASRPPISLDRETSVRGAQKQYALYGQARELNGQPVAGADVLFTVRSGGVSSPAMENTIADGSFLCELANQVESGYAIALATPPRSRSDLGMVAPDAMPLVQQGNSTMLQAPLMFAPSIPFVGMVRDELGVPLQNVLVLPCIVDEVFGTVLQLLLERTFSNPAGMFALERLPGRLPPQQALYLVLHRPGYAVAVVAIPQRHALAAELPFAPIVMAATQGVRLTGLPANRTLPLLEELPGLPQGTGVWRRMVTTDASGTVNWIEVGRGNLWFVEPGAPLVRALVLDGFVGMQQFRPSQDPPLPWNARFRQLQGIPDTTLEIVSSYRHQNTFVGPVNASTSRTVSVLDIAGNPVGNAQVFLGDGVGPAASARFVGFTGPNGMLQWHEIGGSHVTVIAADGRVAVGALALGSGGNLSIELPPCGRASLAEPRRPGPGQPQVVALRFEHADDTPETRRPAAVRFASAMTSWEVGDLVPGEYRVVIGGIAQLVTVPPQGWATIE